MAIIAQKEIFRWEEIDELGDLQRFLLVIENLPDEELMIALEKKRDKGRNDFPIRAVWNSILAGVVFEHSSIESLRRELKRNAQLRQICGFDIFKGLKAVPPEYVYSRFLKLLIKHFDLLQEMFNTLVKELTELLPDLGETLASDGKAIPSFAKKKGTHEGDLRGEHDADWGKHEYNCVDDQGNTYKKIKKWFGFTLHLVVDAKYELPVAFTVSKASKNEMPYAHVLLNRLETDQEEIINRCKYWLSDRGQDDGKMIRKLWDKHEIKPIIDIRNTWKDTDKTRLVPGTENVVYDWKGKVCCVSFADNTVREMAFGGFEKNRGTLKYICPAIHYGLNCKGCKKCPVKTVIRIPMEIDRRIFTPVARSSYKWKRIYKKRTSVERVNSRIDNLLGFENHKIRGLKKMSIRLLISFCILLAMAKGRIKNNEQEKLRQFNRAA
ncbi:MAG: transposase [Ignavibacteriaceae bacterium]